MRAEPAPVRRAADVFARVFGGVPDGTWWAPGRVNLIGEHTDYNDGFVLPLALGRGVAAAVRLADRPLLRAHSVQQGATEQAVPADVAPGTVRGWFAYVAGLAWALRPRALPGLDVVVDGDVPLGAGLSSSAALTCAVAAAWTELAGLAPGPDGVAEAARRSENDVAGAPTGVMDQLASVHGRAGHLVLIDARTRAVEHVPFDLAAAGLALLVLDTRTPHALVTGEYAARRRSCEEAARRLGVRALRDVDLAAVQRLGDGLLRRRARHVVSENARVLDVADTLRDGADPRRTGPALSASHASMRDDFAITVPQVDVAVDAALAAGAHGARMTGGGFGGCVVALVDAGAVDRVAGAVAGAFRRAGFTPPVCSTPQPSVGARRVL